MTDIELPSELVQRLHLLRVNKGLTIAQMAEACALPKSSMESYMRLSGAKRPGIDALLAIAEGMSVSLDWLVGRSENIDNLEASDFAEICHFVVLKLLASVFESVASNSGAIDLNEKRINGQEWTDIAARSAIEFMELAARSSNIATASRGNPTAFSQPDIRRFKAGRN